MKTVMVPCLRQCETQYKAPAGGCKGIFSLPGALRRQFRSAGGEFSSREESARRLAALSGSLKRALRVARGCFPALASL